MFEALKAGKEIVNPATWKNRQVTLNNASILVSAVAALGNSLGWWTLNPEVVSDIALFVAPLLGLINTALIYMTSKKVGLP